MNIPILMYHKISGYQPESHSYTISEHMFKQQLQYLSDNDYCSLLLTEFLSQLTAGEMTFPERSVVLTFDDTQASNYTTALPLLQAYGFKATFFICTDFIGKGDDVLNADQIREMGKLGMSVQSHSHTHAFLNDLSADQIYSELKTSKTILEEIISKGVTLLSCPGGRYNETVLNIAKHVGYKGLCISEPAEKRKDGYVQLFGRFLIDGKTDLQTFSDIVNMDRTYILKKQLVYYLKSILKKILGNNLYQKLWEAARTSKKMSL